MPSPTRTIACALFAALAAVPAAAQEPVGPPPQAAANVYRLAPFHADFPVALAYPVPSGRDYDRTRRQMLERVVANLQGNVRREAWQMAMEFFWRAPEDAVEPLVEAMDRAYGNPALADFVKNVVEAMGKLGNERCDAALQRALEHKNPLVRQAALAALGPSGTAATLRKLFPFFPQMDARARAAWLQAARQKLGAEAVPMLQQLMAAEFPTAVRDQVLREALLLPPAEAARVLKTRWADAVGEFKAIVASRLHADGDAAGTTWLLEALQGEDLPALTLALRHVAGVGPLGPLRDPVLRLSTHPRPEIRLEVARALVRVDGDDVAQVYEVLAAGEEPWEIRSVAVRELTRRGHGQIAGALLEDLPTATGTRLQTLLNLLAASGDARCVPVFVERFRKAPVGEGRPFLQALATSQSPAAATALFELFAGPEVAVGAPQADGGRLTTLNYVPTLLLNLRGAEQVVLDAFAGLPRDDYRHRAALLPTVAGLAADRADPQLKQRCHELLRGILFDRQELPQLRVLALNLLTVHALTLDDALRLKNTRHDEAPPLRALFGDWLNDFF